MYADEVVVGWVTTSQSSLLYAFVISTVYCPINSFHPTQKVVAANIEIST